VIERSQSVHYRWVASHRSVGEGLNALNHHTGETFVGAFNALPPLGCRGRPELSTRLLTNTLLMAYHQPHG
jgi:hypothetical protein